MRNALFAPLLLVAAGCATPTGAEGTERPNIVFILADDLGWADPGFHGSTAGLTPHIDRLAAQGVQLSRHYAHSVCAATRAALLTGRYAFRTHMDWRSEDFGKPTYLAKMGLELAHGADGRPTRMLHALDTRERTVAEALRDVGYTTGVAGKWHLGEWLPEHLPMAQGFDHQYGHYGWGIDYTNYTIPHNAPARFAVYDWHRDQQPVQEQGYTTDLIANEVVRWIAAQDGARPFFFYVPFNAIHGPLESIPRYTDAHDKRSAAIRCLDDAVGRILGALEQYGFADDTLVVFTNDNGGLRDEFNRPLKGTKNTTYEGGVRVPCVVRWPGHIEPGTKNDSLMHMVDWMPTFVGMTGGELSRDREVDGVDMCCALFKSSPSPREEIVFEVAGSVRIPTILSGRFKLMGERLFDLEEDPGETTDVAGAHPEVVARLRVRLSELSAARPSIAEFLGPSPQLMSPALPFVYGQLENATAAGWVKAAVGAVRATQPTEWAPGTTPWPQAPTGDTIEYTGDGR